MVATTASADFTYTYAVTDSPAINFNCIITCLGPFMTTQDFRDRCNEMRLEEHRKDVFRTASINPSSLEHRPKVINRLILAQKNFQGRTSKSY